MGACSEDVYTCDWDRIFDRHTGQLIRNVAVTLWGAAGPAVGCEAMWLPFLSGSVRSL